MVNDVAHTRSRPDSTTPIGEWAFTASMAGIRRVLLLALTAVVVLDVLASAGAAEGAPWTITRFFNGDQKMNVPTAFKTTALLAITIGFILLTALAQHRRDPFAPGWRLLSWVTAFAFVDESTFLHQSLSRAMHHHLHLHGVLAFSWTVVYGPTAIAAGVLLLRHLRHLPIKLSNHLLAGGGLYVLGAIVFEPVKSEIAQMTGQGSLTFQLVAAVSDSLEMIGLTGLLIVVLTETGRRSARLTVHLRD